MRIRLFQNSSALLVCLICVGCSSDLAPHQREYLKNQATSVAHELPLVASDAALLGMLVGDLEPLVDEGPSQFASRVRDRLEGLREWNGTGLIEDGSADGYLVLTNWDLPYDFLLNGNWFSARLDFRRGERGLEVILSERRNYVTGVAATATLTWDDGMAPWVSYAPLGGSGLTFRGPLQFDPEQAELVLDGEGSWVNNVGWGPIPVQLTGVTFRPSICSGVDGVLELGPADVMVNSATILPVLTTVSWEKTAHHWFEWIELEGRRERARVLSPLC